MDTPDDLLFLTVASNHYQVAGDHARAPKWLTHGLNLALRTGDPEELLPQLAEQRRESMQAPGREPDEFQRHAEQTASKPAPKHV